MMHGLPRILTSYQDILPIEELRSIANSRSSTFSNSWISSSLPLSWPSSSDQLLQPSLDISEHCRSVARYSKEIDLLLREFKSASFCWLPCFVGIQILFHLATVRIALLRSRISPISTLLPRGMEISSGVMAICFFLDALPLTLLVLVLNFGTSTVSQFRQRRNLNRRSSNYLRWGPGSGLRYGT
jgi:hypothetical protein